MEENKNKRRTVAKTEPKLADIGKMPPQAIELEEAVLGALMLEGSVAAIVMNILKPESFYKSSHETIFKACQQLYRNSAPIDILTVTEQLKKNDELDDVGGAYFIATITNRVASAGNIEFHSRIIQQKFIQRELIRVCTKTITEAYDSSSDVFDMLDHAERNLFSISQGTYKKEAIASPTLYNMAIAEMEANALRKDGLSGVPSGLIDLDRLTGGWQNSDLIIVAARPAMGKTAFAITVAKNAAIMFKKSVAVFSLEMSGIQLMKRVISAESKVNSSLFKNTKDLKDSDWFHINNAGTGISNSKIYIDDTPSLSIFEFRSKARRLKDQHKIELIVVDYLQLMTVASDNGNGNREQEISLISRSLKAVAKELNIPVIALSQLSRAVESRGGEKEPQLSDLRESGAIEQDADIVIFPHRPEYYGIMEDDHGNSTAGKAKLIIAKHREGPTGHTYTQYISQLTTFCDIDYTPQSQLPFEDNQTVH